MEILLLCLSLLGLASGTSGTSLFDGRFFIENSEPREDRCRLRGIRFMLRETFFNGSRIRDGCIEWIQYYGGTENASYIREHIPELASAFSNSNLDDDAKIMELAAVLHKLVKDDNEFILGAAFWFYRAGTGIANYLKGSGFPVNEYSLNELISMFPKCVTPGFEYGKPTTYHEIMDFVTQWPEAVSYFQSYDQIKEMQHLLREGKPANLIIDMLKMEISHLKTFSELSIMADDKIRPLLLPLFNQIPQLKSAPELFRQLAEYPEAVKCLETAQDPNKIRKQGLLILFSHHVTQGSCDTILELDLREKVGGWRQNIYEGRNYLTAWDEKGYSYANIDHKDIRDRVILDSLWLSINRPRLNSCGAFERKTLEIVRSIVEEERQGFIYHQLEFGRNQPAMANYESDELIPELEEKICDERITHFGMSDNKIAGLLLSFIIPRLFPNRASRIALSIDLDRNKYFHHTFYVDNILREYLLKDDQAQLKTHVIEGLQKMFEIQIDLSVLNDLQHSKFERFATSAYERVKETSIQFIEIEKLADLYRRKRPVEKMILSEEIISKVISIYSKNEGQGKLIRRLIGAGKNSNVFFDILERTEDIPKYLNFLYSMDNRVSFFEHTLYNIRGFEMKAYLSNLSRISALSSFGHDFLNDIAALVPHDEVEI